MSKISERFKQHSTSLRTREDNPKAKIPHPSKKIMHHKHGDHLNVLVCDLYADPDQPRKSFDEKGLTDLSMSIKDRGILQPLLIRFTEDKFWIVAGERRYRAAKMAGLESVPCIVTTGEPSEISLIENIQRENLSPIELVNALDKMMVTHGYNQTQLGKIIGKSPQTVNSILSIKKLPESVKKDLSARGKDEEIQIPRRTLIEIAQEPNEFAEELYSSAKGGATSEEIREKRRLKALKTKTIKKRPEVLFLVEKFERLIKALENIEDLKRFRVQLRSQLDNLEKQLSRFR